MAFKLILGKLGELAFSKLAEKTTDKAFHDFNNVKDFQLILKTLHKNLKLLSAKAADVEEEIKNAEVSGRKKRKREVKEWLEEVESIKQQVVELGSPVESGGFIRRLMDGGKATQLNEQVEKLVQQSLNFKELMLDDRGTRGETLPTNGMVGEASKENFKTIWKLLEDRQVSKIGVYGMGGVGKTTLAMHIHNRLLHQPQGRVFWITVSQEFTIESLQDKIARRLGVDLSNEDEEAMRAGKLKRFLSQEKNSVLILDDVWEEIDMMRVGCTFSPEGCRLIITTRSLEVCHRIGPMKVIQLVKLCKEEAWELFNETLGEEINLGPRVEEIAKSMAEVCDGLPLGIITVAGSMKGDTNIHTWNNALAELKDCVVGGQNVIGEVDKVFRVLKYSFDRLKKNDEREGNEPNMIQHCFMYCSLYPEDRNINRGNLVRKFISEGLVEERKSRKAQVEQGLSVLDKLVKVCLLESCVDYDGEECVKMHDLVRSMALKMYKGKYMVRAGELALKEILNEEEWSKDLEKVSFMFSGINIIREGISPDCPKLSTLLLSWNFGLKVIPNSFFSKMQGLCTLDLCWNSDIKMLPNSVSDLTSLKALLLEDCDELEYVPYLGKLKALRELNLSGTAIKEAPQGLEELLKLRFLSMEADGLKMLPRGVLLKLGHLQHLNLPLHIQVEIEEIENLKQLEELGGGVKNVKDFNWFITTSEVRHTCCYRRGIGLQFNPFDFARKDNFERHYNVLELHGCNLKDEKILGQGIGFLRIISCEGLNKCFVDDLASRFDSPTSLKKIRIEYCGGIEWILRSDGQEFQISNTPEVIDLWGLDDLKGAVVMQRGETGASSPIAPAQLVIFSSLKILSIGGCNKMRKVGVPVSRVPNLERISINNCEEVEEIFEDDERRDVSVTTLLKLQSLRLSGLPSLKKVGLPASEVPNLERIEIKSCAEIEEIWEEDDGTAASILTTPTLPKLKYLTLCNLPRLKSVSKATIICNSIEEINLRGCPRLKNKLPVHFDDSTPPPNLRRIKVKREWWESLEWNSNPNLPQLLQPFLHFDDGFLDIDGRVPPYTLEEIRGETELWEFEDTEEDSGGDTWEF